LAFPSTSAARWCSAPVGTCAEYGLEQDELNRVLMEAVQARRRAFVTGTVFGGREALRDCILHPTRARSASRSW
jgi:hypothetical protein